MKTGLSVFSYARYFFSRSMILVFLNGFLLALLVYFKIEDNYETSIFKALAANVQQELSSQHVQYNEDSVLLKSMHLVHTLENKNMQVFGDKEMDSWKAKYIQPVTYDLMTGRGACGSHSLALGRLLKEQGIHVRFGQMIVNGEQGGHIVVEAKTKNGWVVMDPLYDLTFTKADGQLASFADVSRNWQAFVSQVPADYNHDYRYEGVTYTNWHKVPVISSVLYKGLTITMGKASVDEISLRNIFLRKWNFLFDVTLLLYILLTAYMIRGHIKKVSRTLTSARMFPQPGGRISMAGN